MFYFQSAKTLQVLSAVESVSVAISDRAAQVFTRENAQYAAEWVLYGIKFAVVFVFFAVQAIAKYAFLRYQGRMLPTQVDTALSLPAATIAPLPAAVPVAKRPVAAKRRRVVKELAA